MLQFKAGDTRSINGVTYERDESGSWRPKSGGSVQLTPPNPKLPGEMTLQQQNIERGQQDIARTGVQMEGDRLSNAGRAYDVEAKPVYDRAGAIRDWTKDIQSDERIKTYRMALPVWASGLRAPPTSEGDQLLVNAFAKVMDPLTGIQQGESQQIQGLAPSFEQVRARLMKEFGADGSGNFTPEARRRIKQAITTRMQELATSNNAARAEWRERLKAAGLPDVDPETILGPHAGGAFQQVEADFLGRPIRNLDGSQGAVPADFDLRNFGGQTTFDPNSPRPLEVTVSYDKMPWESDQAYRERAKTDAPPPPMPEGWTGYVPEALRRDGLLEQAGNSLLNVFAGQAEGLASLPDMLAQGAGSLMAAPADLLGFDNVANQLRNPLQIGEQIEQAVPVPQDWNNWSARQVSRLGGGIAGLPKRAVDNVLEQFIGAVPKGFNPTAVPKADPRSVYQDARSLGIEPTVEAVGGPTSRTLNSLLSQSLAGSATTRSGAQRMVDQGGAALSNIAGRQGSAAEREVFGETAKAGALRFKESSRSSIGRMYDRAAKVAGDTRVTPERTLSELDRNIAELSQVPGGGEGVAFLRTLRDEIAQMDGGITIQGFRGMRTTLRDKFIKDGLRGSDIERRVNGVVESVGEDIAASLGAAGKGNAAKLFRNADAAWAERVRTIDEVVVPIIGRKGEKSGEQVAAALTSASRNKGNSLNRFLRALPEEEAGDVRASMIEALGRAKDGAQDATGEVFSFNTLMTNWTKLDQSARNALFQSKSDREAMDRLVKVASEVKDASRYANTSNSGGAIINGLTLYTGAMDTSSGAIVGVGSYALAKALQSPGVASIVARIGSMGRPAQIEKAAGQLTAIANKYPGAAAEIVTLRDSIISLARAANDNVGQVGRSVARDNEEDNKNQPGY